MGEDETLAAAAGAGASAPTWNAETLDSPGREPPSRPTSAASQTLDSAGGSHASWARATLHAEFSPAGAAQTTEADAASLPTIDRGAYAIISTLGQGGLGRVYRAIDRRLGREVALKELLSPSPTSEQRFVREALVTARLQHPGIVPVYEAGRTAKGEPFYAMKHVAGEPLEAAIDACTTIAQRLALVPKLLDVAEAIAYAHHEGVIHRDLKPGNVMLGAFGEVVVIDWGLARSIGDDGDDGGDPDEFEIVDGALTIAGAVVGTPVYMPPEQARGAAVDARADVYSLGAILYQLLSGATPYDGANPYAILNAVQSGPPLPLAERVPGLSGELAAIVAKAMAREPGDRYADAGELAEDLRRFTNGQLVGAHEYTLGQRVRRFVRRHLALLAVIALALLAVIAIGSYSLGEVLEARHAALAERDRARDERDLAEAARAEAIANADALTIAEARAAVRERPNDAVEGLTRLSPGFSGVGEARLITAEAASLGLATVLRGHERGLNFVVFSPDETRLATSSDDHTVRVWSRDGRELRTLRGHEDEAWLLRFVDDEHLLTSGKDGQLLLWDLADGSRRALDSPGQTIYFLELVGDGRSLAFVSGKELWLLDLESGERRPLPLPAPRRSRGVKASAADVLAIDVEGGLAVVDLRGVDLRGDLRDVAPRLLPLPQRPRARAEMTSDGRLVAAATGPQTITVWSVADGSSRRQTLDLDGDIDVLAFAPAGDELAVGDQSGAITRVRIGAAGIRSRGALVGHEGAITGLHYSPDGRFLASASGDRSARLWDLEHRSERTLRGFGDITRFLAFSRDASVLAVTSYDGTARLFPTRPRRDRPLAARERPLAAVHRLAEERLLLRSAAGDIERMTLETGDVERLGGRRLKATATAVSGDGRWIAAATADGVALLDAAAAGEDAPRRLAGPPGAASAVCFAGARWLVAGDDAAAWAWELGEDGLPAGAEARRLGVHDGGRTHLRCAHRRPAAASGGGRLALLYNLETGATRRLDDHGGAIEALAFAADDGTLAVGTDDHQLHLWPAAGGDDRILDVGGNRLWDVAFLADGEHLTALQGATSLRLWDRASGQRVRSFVGHTAPIVRIVLADDGLRAMTLARDGSLLLWDLASGASRPLGTSGEAIVDALFSADGERLYSVGRDGVVRLWHDDLPRDEAGLRAAWTELLSSTR